MLPVFEGRAEIWDAIAVGMLVMGIAVALTALSFVRVVVDERGLLVRFGLLGRPSKRIPLERVVGARAGEFWPREVGGWGYRRAPTGTAVMVRGGECLVVMQSGDRADFIVSVDDAERAAALLNTLRDARN